ncbi:MAG: aminotransferase class IV [Nostocoides sp.]
MSEQFRVWVDGRLVGADEPAVPALDHAVTVGDAAFETLKVEGGVPFAPTRHLRRLQRSMAGLGLPAPDVDRIEEGITAVLGAGPALGFGRLRYMVTGGAGPLGSDRGGSPLTYIVTAGPQPRPPAAATLATVAWIRNERAATVGLKTTSYAENVIALAAAHEHGAIEAIFANTRDELCEATGSNIFLVRSGVVLTPPLSSGCLAGVTRELLLEWAREAGIEVREDPIALAAAYDVDEVFITSSTKDVLPISGWEGRSYAAPGPVTAKLAALFTGRSAQDADP